MKEKQKMQLGIGTLEDIQAVEADENETLAEVFAKRGLRKTSEQVIRDLANNEYSASDLVGDVVEEGTSQTFVLVSKVKSQ